MIYELLVINIFQKIQKKKKIIKKFYFNNDIEIVNTLFQKKLYEMNSSQFKIHLQIFKNSRYLYKIC